MVATATSNAVILHCGTPLFVVEGENSYPPMRKSIAEGYQQLLHDVSELVHAPFEYTYVVARGK